MANQTIFDLTAETAMTASHRVPVQDTGASTAAQSATFALMGGLEWDTYGTPNQNNAAVVGKIIGWDISTLSADRNWTLPNDAKLGERCGIFITTGDDAYEVDILTDSTNSQINGVAHGSTSWSRLFIANECLILRCIKAGGADDTDWIVEYDGRIPQQGILNRTTVATNYFTDGNWLAIPGNVAEVDIGDITDNSNYNFTFRRAGQYFVSGVIALDAVNTDDGCFCKIVSDPATAQNTKHLGLWQTAPSTTEYIASNAAGIVEITNSDLGTVTAVIAALGKYNNNTAGTAESGLAVCIQTATEIL